MFKNRYNQVKSFVRRHAVEIGTGCAGALATAQAFAEDSGITAAAKTGIDVAKADGMTVGGYVVAAVAGMVVIGVIIGLVKKI